MNDSACTENSALLAPVVSSTADLSTLLARLDSQPAEAVSLDTEADSFHHYYEKVCLVQVAVGGSAWLVDPLAGIDLAPLLTRLSSRLLLMHGADYDLRLLVRGHGFRASVLFDTMLAAQLLGLEEIGLAALLKQRLSVELDKANQRDDWSARPLSGEQVAYAARDVLFLPALVESLTKDLVAKKRVEWHREECARLVASPLTQKEGDPDNDWRLKGTNGMTGCERAFVRELWMAREARARETDRPPFRVLTNERLLHAARIAANGERDLGKLFPGPRPLPQPVARAIREALEKAHAVPAESWPSPRRSERAEAEPLIEKIVDRLKRRRDEASKQLGLSSGVVGPKATLTAAARALVKSPNLTAEEVAAESGISRWRAALLIEGASLS